MVSFHQTFLVRCVVSLVVLQESVVDVEDKEQLRDVGLTLHQVFGQHCLTLIEVEVLDLNLESELLWQILSFDQEIPLFEIIDLAIKLVVERNMMHLPFPVHMIVDMTLKVNILSLCLSNRDVRDLNHVVRHHPIVVDGVEGAFHELASLQEIVDFVCEDSLAMGVPLNLEHELPPCHTISDPQCFVEHMLVLIQQVEAKHESLLFQVFVVLKLEVCDVRVLLLRFVLDGQRQQTQGV